MITTALKPLLPEAKLNNRDFLYKLDDTLRQVSQITSQAKLTDDFSCPSCLRLFLSRLRFSAVIDRSRGKEPSPRQIVALVEQAKSLGIKKVFIQPQYSSKGATLIAKQIGAEVVNIDPYAKDIFACWLQIAKEFSN